MPRPTPAITAWFDREDAIVSMAVGRSVLHLGCVGDPDRTPGWLTTGYPASLHARLRAVADTVGVDTNAEVVGSWLERHGVDDVLVGDVEDLASLPLAPAFDLIVAADVIEHVSNPGRLLDGIHALCRPATIVVVTTPNAFGLPAYLRYGRGAFTDGEGHVTAHNPVTLVNLLERHGFRLLDLATCHQSTAAGTRAFRVGAPLLRRFPRFGGTLFATAATA